MGPDRVHRFRGTADPYRAPSEAVRRPTSVVVGGRVRRRDRRDEPAPRSGIDAARHLLRLAAPRPDRGDPGGICFILPGLVRHPRALGGVPRRRPTTMVLGAAAGAGAAVPVVAVHAGLGLMPASWGRVAGARARAEQGSLAALSRRGSGVRGHRGRASRARADRLRGDRGHRPSAIWPPRISAIGGAASARWRHRASR